MEKPRCSARAACRRCARELASRLSSESSASRSTGAASTSQTCITPSASHVRRIATWFRSSEQFSSTRQMRSVRPRSTVSALRASRSGSSTESATESGATSAGSVAGIGFGAIALCAAAAACARLAAACSACSGVSLNFSMQERHLRRWSWRLSCLDAKWAMGSNCLHMLHGRCSPTGLAATGTACSLWA